jgi:hypothetical protein
MPTMEGRKGMFKASHGKELYFETWSQHDSAAAGTGGSVAVFLTGVHESADTTTVRELAGLFAGELGHEFVRAPLDPRPASLCPGGV